MNMFDLTPAIIGMVSFGILWVSTMTKDEHIKEVLIAFSMIFFLADILIVYFYDNAGVINLILEMLLVLFTLVIAIMGGMIVWNSVQKSVDSL